MPNPTPARYTVQLGPTVTPEVAGELATWAEVQQRSVSEATRECIEAGLMNLRLGWIAEAGRALDAELLEKHVYAAEVRGAEQVARRERYASRTREARQQAALDAAKPQRGGRRRATAA